MRDGSEETKAKAPISTAFAEAMKDVFAEVQLLRLKEGGVEVGRPDPFVYATCFQLKKKKK